MIRNTVLKWHLHTKGLSYYIMSYYIIVSRCSSLTSEEIEIRRKTSTDRSQTFSCDE